MTTLSISYYGLGQNLKQPHFFLKRLTKDFERNNPQNILQAELDDGPAVPVEGVEYNDGEDDVVDGDDDGGDIVDDEDDDVVDDDGGRGLEEEEEGEGDDGQDLGFDVGGEMG